MKTQKNNNGAKALKQIDVDKTSKNKFNFKDKFKGKGDRNLRRGKMFNDVSWYTKNPGITDAFAKLPFNFIQGGILPIPTGGISGSVKGIKLGALSSFGVDWLPSVVNSRKVDDRIVDQQGVLDQVATIIYTQMRRANSGATNDIEYVDPVITNLLASVDILCNAVSMRRVFKIANSFTWKNRAIPKDIFVSHLGIDYDDFIKRQAEYRGRFNTLVALARTIRTLANYPFLNAICAEFENIFKDSDTDTGRESFIIPVKMFNHIYDPVGTTTNPGGSVRLMKLSDITKSGSEGHDRVLFSGATSGLRKFEADLKILETQITVLINDGDFNLLQADIEKAFGEQSSYMVIDSVPDNEAPLAPIYSGEFATMFHNGIFLPLPENALSTSEYHGSKYGYLYIKDSYVNTIGQWHATDGGEIKMLNIARVAYKRKKIEQPSVVCNGFLLDTELNDPTPTDIVMMTRYHSTWVDGDIDDVDDAYALPTISDDKYTYDKIVPGVASNFITFGGKLTTFQYNADGTVSTAVTDWHNTMAPSSSGGNLSNHLWQFKNKPLIRILAGGTLTDPIFGFLEDLNNVRCVNDSELLAIQQACFLSLWDLPSKSTI